MINCFCYIASIMLCCTLPFGNKRDKKQNDTYCFEKYAILPEEVKFVDCPDDDTTDGE